MRALRDVPLRRVYGHGMDFSYEAVGSTCAEAVEWRGRPSGYRAFERSVSIGRGDGDWAAASDALMSWAIKTRSGFDVRSEAGSELRVHESQDFTLIARLGSIRVREPVRVVAVVDEPDRRGFAYGTRPGHPVAGEEAFVLSRSVDGEVWLTLRSLTRAARGRWRLAFPLALIAQHWYRYRYLRALRA